jgi:NADH:ubiquinone oxidoreductase subunit 5 (subunit L)/multisubunit Na+/H+ antiporter MnhA subunit
MASLPDYHLHIWHGLNLPLLMSLLALLGGGLLYYNRQRLFTLQTYFPERNESQLFDDALHRLAAPGAIALWPGLTTAPCSALYSGCFSWPWFFRWCR